MRIFLCRRCGEEGKGDQRNGSGRNCKVKENFPYTLWEEECESVRNEAL